MAPRLLLLALVLLPIAVAYGSHDPLPSGLEAQQASSYSSSSPFDEALDALQKRIGYGFRSPGLLRRAMTHASYSRENGRALAILGLAASQSAAALRALAADHDAAASAVSRRAREAAGEAACAAAGARVGIPAIVRVAAGTKASAAPCAPSSVPLLSTMVPPTPPEMSSGGCTSSPPHQQPLLCEIDGIQEHQS